MYFFNMCENTKKTYLLGTEGVENNRSKYYVYVIKVDTN